MKSRKVLSIVLIVAMAATLILSACSNDSSTEPAETPGTSDSSTPSDSSDSSGSPDAPEAGSDLAQQIAQSAIDYTLLVQSEIKDGAVSSKDSLTFAAVADPGAISIDNMLDFTMMPMCTLAQEYFLQWDFEKGEYYSAVCDSYEADEDHMGVTFHITPGIKMNDGNTFGASDLVTSIKAFREHNGMGWQLDFVDLENSEIIDENTLHLRFNQLNGVWETGFLMFTVISGKAYEAVNGDDSFYQAPIGPMPYNVTEWVPGDHITVTRFDDYYKGTPPIKTVTMKVISDRTAAFMALQNGEIDLLWNISADQVETAYSSEALELIMTGKNMMIYLGMNSGNKALSDLRVRQAIYYAVNRDDIIRGAYDGLAFPANSIMTPENIGYNTEYDTKSPFPAQDINKAKELLAEAGYGDGLTLRILAESTINFQLVTEQLAAQLGEIGITLEPTLTDAATQNSIIFSGDTTEYDLYLAVAQCANDAVSFMDNPMLFGASHPELSADGSGDEWSELWAKIRVTPDITERAELYKDVQTYFFDKGYYWLPLAVSQTYVGLDKGLTGMRRGGIMLYFDHAYFK
jgi:ABC-type transport system substrate-binding protein